MLLASSLIRIPKSKGEPAGAFNWLCIQIKRSYVYDTTSNTWYQPFYYRWNDEGHWTKEFGFQPVVGYPTLHNQAPSWGPAVAMKKPEEKWKISSKEPYVWPKT